jgi:hypothetical protein
VEAINKREELEGDSKQSYAVVVMEEARGSTIIILWPKKISQN